MHAEDVPAWGSLRDSGRFDFRAEGETLSFLRVEGFGKRDGYAGRTFYICDQECPQWLWLHVGSRNGDFNNGLTKYSAYSINRNRGRMAPVNNVSAPAVEWFCVCAQGVMSGVGIPDEAEWEYAMRYLRAERNIESERGLVGKTIDEMPAANVVGYFASGGGIFNAFSNVEEMCMGVGRTPAWPNGYVRKGGSWISSPKRVGVEYQIETLGANASPQFGFRLIWRPEKMDAPRSLGSK